MALFDGLKLRIKRLSITCQIIGFTSITLLSDRNSFRYLLTSSQFVEDSIQVYYNGMLQIQGGSDDYTEDGDRRGVTFALAPEAGSKVVVIYSESA